MLGIKTRGKKENKYMYEINKKKKKNSRMKTKGKKGKKRTRQRTSINNDEKMPEMETRGRKREEKKVAHDIKIRKKLCSK